MRYRHAFHAGNFADVHKHIGLLAITAALTRKDKGLLLIDTHAGRGLYDLAGSDAAQSAEAAGGVEVLLQRDADWPPEIAAYVAGVRDFRRSSGWRHAYPGSPMLALAALRAQDRLVLIESQPEEHAALAQAVRRESAARLPAERITVECADGYARLGAWLPPIERRALLFLDPPYEDTARDFRAVAAAALECLRRLANAVVVIWYPIKDAADTDRWRARLVANLPPQAGGLATPTCTVELWRFPCDNKAGLNGSGLLLINPPWQFAERAAAWLPVLHEVLDQDRRGGWAVR